MKTIVSLLLVLCLVSCSQPKPPPAPQAKYEPVELNNEPTTVVHSQNQTTATTAVQPAQTTTSAPVLPMGASNEVTEAVAPPAEPAIVHTNADGSTTHPNASTTPSPFGHPEQPSVPATPPAPGSHEVAANASTASTAQETLLPELSVNFHAAPIDLVLQTLPPDFVRVATLLRVFAEYQRANHGYARSAKSFDQNGARGSHGCRAGDE